MLNTHKTVNVKFWFGNEIHILGFNTLPEVCYVKSKKLLNIYFLEAFSEKMLELVIFELKDNI